MEIMEAMQTRHSVRQYIDQPIGAECLAALEAEIDGCKKQPGQQIQLVKNEPQAFNSLMAHYGKFSGVSN